MGKPVLSIGMIVKNEIRSIERCLKALQPLRDRLACELIIADTGSTDGTIEIAKRYADIFFEFPWCNDFSAARNAVMDRSSGEWYLTVDADEYLDADCTQLIEFLKSSKQRKTDFGMIMQRNYTKADMSGEFEDFPAIRMVRMKTKKRYEGRIHESWDVGKINPIILLEQTILHHDGYAFFSAEKRDSKKRRNLALLEQELQENPRDLRRLLQCIESSDIFPQEGRGYLRKAMDVVADTTTPKWKQYAPPICRYAVELASRFEMPEHDKWLEFTKQHLGESIYYKIDIAYNELSQCYQKGDYEQAYIWQKLYWEGVQEANSMPKQIFFSRTSKSSLRYYTPEKQRKIRYVSIDVDWRLHRMEEAVDECLRLDVTLEELANSKECLPILQKLCNEPKVQEMVGTILKSMDENQEWKKHILTRIQMAFEDQSNLYRLYRQAPGELGYAVQAMDAVGDELRDILSKIENWSLISYKVIRRTIEQGIPLPESFYQRNKEALEGTAKAVFHNKGYILAKYLRGWMEQEDFTQSLIKLQFQFNLLAGAATCISWTQKELSEYVGYTLLQVGNQYMNELYSQTLIHNPHNWNATPIFHHYMLILLNGYEKLVQGNELGWTASLREAIEVLPTMKGMVQFFMEHPPETPRSRELKELASKVKALLSQYPEDDPAVLTIKQSPIYQKVAHLIEEPEQVTFEPVYEAPDPQLNEKFNALMEKCVFDSQEEALQQIQNVFYQIDNVNQGLYARYWEMYPLWGKNTGEVLNNIATAFYKNQDKFKWMYDHLQDNQSRKVFTSVLCRWRYFDTEQDSSVKEMRYDDYFDRELVFCDEDEVFVDLGGYIGDTFLSYIKNYGPCKCYYCYEISKENFEKISKLVQEHSELDCRLKGAGDKADVMYLHTGNHDSANHLEKSGLETVEVVAIDEDITEPITFLKMDIEGAEQSALRGCEQHIKEDKPKLALSVYHNFEDIWKLAYMVEEWVPGYHFYLRYHGGSGWPSEITLIGLPPQ